MANVLDSSAGKLTRKVASTKKSSSSGRTGVSGGGRIGGGPTSPIRYTAPVKSRSYGSIRDGGPGAAGIGQPGRSASTASQGSQTGSNSLGNYSGISGGGGIGGTGGTSSFGGAPAGVAATPAVPDVSIPTKDNWLAGDTIFGGEQTALQSALKQMYADLDLQKSNYGTDFAQNMGDLGWDEASKSWDKNDKLTSYGSSYNNQLEDFASRGMFDSSAYAQSLNDLNRGFDDQRSSMLTGRDTFNKGNDLQRSGAGDQTKAAVDQARIESIMRRAAQYGL